MKRSNLIHSLPIVAIALGHKYKVKVTIGGNQAKTDGDTIILPCLPPDDAGAAVLAYGYLDHEAGHIRLSDFECFASCQCPLERDLLNILEDIRIELKMSRLYPGCRSNLNRLTRKLVEDGVFGKVFEGDNAVSILHGYLLYRLRLEVLGQRAFLDLSSQAQAHFVRLFPEALTKGIDRLLGRVPDLSSTKESLALAREIMNLMRDQTGEPQREEKIDASSGEDRQTIPTDQRSGKVSRASSSRSQVSQSCIDQLPSVADCGEIKSVEAETSCPNLNSDCQLGSGTSPVPPSIDSSLESRWNPLRDVRKAIKELLSSKGKDIPPDFGTLISTELQSFSAATPTETSPSKPVSRGEARDPCHLLNRIRSHTRALRTRLEGVLQASRREGL